MTTVSVNGVSDHRATLPLDSDATSALSEIVDRLQKAMDSVQQRLISGSLQVTLQEFHSSPDRELFQLTLSGEIDGQKIYHEKVHGTAGYRGVPHTINPMHHLIFWLMFLLVYGGRNENLRQNSIRQLIDITTLEFENVIYSELGLPETEMDFLWHSVKLSGWLGLATGLAFYGSCFVWATMQGDISFRLEDGAINWYAVVLAPALCLLLPCLAPVLAAMSIQTLLLPNELIEQNSRGQWLLSLAGVSSVGQLKTLFAVLTLLLVALSILPIYLYLRVFLD